MICVDKNQLIMPQKCNRFCLKIWFFSYQHSTKPDLMERNGCHLLIQQCKNTLNQLQKSRQHSKSKKLLPSVIIIIIIIILQFYYYYFTHLRVFHTCVIWWFSNGFWVIFSLLKSSPVSRTLLSSLADLSNAVVWWSPLVFLFPNPTVTAPTLWWLHWTRQ